MITLNEAIRVGSSPMTGIPKTRENEDTHTYTKKTPRLYEDTGEEALCKPRKEASEETKHANTLILDF